MATALIWRSIVSLATLNSKTISQIVSDDLTPYRGQWIAIRHGRIVASALDATGLRDDPEVHDDDLFLLVPTEAAGTYLL